MPATVMIDYPKLGAAFMTAGTALMQFVSDERAWWIGAVFMTIGPILLSIRHKKKI